MAGSNQSNPTLVEHSKLNFKEFLKNDNDISSIWYYFLREETGQFGKCKDKNCSKILKTKGGSTTALHYHLSHIHKKVVEKVVTSSGSSSSGLRGEPPLKTKRIEHFFPKKQESLSLILSRMAAKDGIPFSIFCTSLDLRNAICSMGLSEQLPKSASTIRNIIMKYSHTIREEQKLEIKKLKTGGIRFCAVFDEWTSMKNRRFLNIIISGRECDIWNLGLIRIKGSMTAEVCLNLVTEKLESCFLSLENDIVSIITDGTSVMTKIGMISSTHQQLCLAHGIQLAVTYVLYKPKGKDDIELITDQTHEVLDSDGEVLSDDESFGVQTDPTQDADIEHSAIKPIILKVRMVVKLFKRSSLKNENLQKHVKADLRLKFNYFWTQKQDGTACTICWTDSTHLKNCILKSLIDLKEPIIIEEWELDRVNDLIAVLGPLKLTVEALCRRDGNLLTADASLNFTIDKLEELRSGIGQELAVSFRRRILERRTDISGVLQYLHTGSYQIDDVYDEDLFKIPVKPRIATILKDLLRRLNPTLNSDLEVEEPQTTNASQGQHDKKKSALQDELNKALENIANRAHMEKSQPDKTLISTIKKEMLLFEAGGTRGRHLNLAYEYIKTIKPTSVESERAFSSAGYLCNKVRSSLRDDTLDELAFLRSYFKLLDTKNEN